MTRGTPRRRGARQSTSSSAIFRATNACLIALVLAAGCGGGDDQGKRGQSTTGRTQTAAPSRTETAPRTESQTQTQPAPRGDAHGGGHQTATSPEDQEGGAGDEEPARSQVMLTGRGGHISPRLVRVPPFISVAVVLRSADGRPYGLRIGGRLLRAGGPVGSSSVRLDGLRAGKAYVGTQLDSGETVRVEASAEPGP